MRCFKLGNTLDVITSLLAGQDFSTIMKHMSADFDSILFSRSHGSRIHHRRGFNEPQSRTPSSSGQQKRKKAHLLYWVSITPLICSALSPISILTGFSACADPWRVMKLPDGSYESEKNPQWVIAITASAVAIAFTANILLLMRIMGRWES